jgi:two-component system, NtrC family, sensor kinase
MANPVQLARRPVLIVWILALLAAVVALAALRLPPITPLAWIGAALIATLVAAGDRYAVSLEDGGVLSPAPALLIAGLSVAGWPLLALAALVGTLTPAFLRAPTVSSSADSLSYTGERASKPLVFDPYSLAAESGRVESMSPSKEEGGDGGVLRALVHNLGIYFDQVARRVPIRDAGARALIVGLLAPIYPLVEPRSTVPYSTLPGLLGLVLLGALAYAVVLLVGALGADRETLLTRWSGPNRWYALAMVPLGGLLGALWSVSPWAFVLGLAPLAVAQHAFRDQLALRRANADLARLAVQRESLAMRLERLQALATTMIGTFDVQAMLELLRERLAALLEADCGWVVLREDDGGPRLIAGRRSPSKDGAQALSDPRSYAPLFERGTVMLIADERLSELAPVSSDPAPWVAVLSIPLIGEQGVLGVICLAFDRLRGLEADEQRVLTSFARQAATVIENVRLFDELNRKQDELIQSSKLAAVGTFAAGIAHEFNNLLAGMLGHAELGYRISDMEEKNRSLDVVIQSCRRGRSITQGLLTFARRREHKRQLVDVAAAIDETLMLVDVDLRKSHIEIIREIDMVTPTVCDLGQIAQVVLNLVTNARDAMKPHGGTLTIGLCEREGAIEIRVGDTGCGIPAAIRDKIFEPFVTTKGALGGSQTPGTGLGLSVSYGIVRDHGGELLVDSVVGAGTTMTVRLPIVEEQVEQAVAVGEY